MENVMLILAIIEKAGLYGVPAVQKIMEAWDKEDITVEDIRGLMIDKDPEEFFE